MSWIEVTIDSEVDAGELLGMLNDPEVTGAWQEHGTIHLYWPAGRWIPETLQSVKHAVSSLGQDGRAAVTVNQLPECDWNALWAQSVKPLRVGRRLVIRASWEAVALNDRDIELILDPKQAFGTGHHATTQLLLEWEEEVIRGGESVLDVGTGSGILAMYALRLGAAHAVGLDCDPVAIDCAREYAVMNGFGPELVFHAAGLQEVVRLERQQFPLVLANLDRRTLLETAGAIRDSMTAGGRLLASGLLLDQQAEVAGAFAAVGLYVSRQRERDGWVALELMAPDACEGMP
jgi:ribosomal protein L11 methyltransferase